MSKAVLDRFGRFIMEELRDKCIWHFDALLDNHMRSPDTQVLQAALQRLTPEAAAAARDAMLESIDGAIHDFLFAVQQNADFENDIHILVDGQNIVPLSDGIHGEAYGDDGWIARFSEYGVATPKEPAVSAFLCEIAETFQITGRDGVVVIAGADLDTTVTVGTKLVAFRPDGSIFETEFIGVELPTPRRPGSPPAFMIRGTKDDLPPGTKLFLAKQ